MYLLAAFEEKDHQKSIKMPFFDVTSENDMKIMILATIFIIPGIDGSREFCFFLELLFSKF